MALVNSRISAALWRKARSNVGIRFPRFTLVAVASVAASQIALSLLLGPAHQTAGFSGGLAAVTRTCDASVAPGAARCIGAAGSARATDAALGNARGTT